MTERMKSRARADELTRPCEWPHEPGLMKSLAAPCHVIARGT